MSPTSDSLRQVQKRRAGEFWRSTRVCYAFDRYPLKDDITNASSPTTVQTLATTAILMAKQDTSDALITAVELVLSRRFQNRISMKEASQWTELRLHPAEQYFRSC